jgi:hypothetical protein
LGVIEDFKPPQVYNTLKRMRNETENYELVVNR